MAFFKKRSFLKFILLRWQVSKTSISVRKSHFLNLTISNYRGKFYIILYDKRKNYSFEVVYYSFLDGNIPKILVRFARINSSFNRFISEYRNFTSKIIGQSFNPAA